MGLKNKHKPESEKTFEYIFESITDGVSLVDAETKKISLGNRSMCNMLGYTRDEIRNITIYDIHPVEALPLVDELFNQLLNRRIELVREIPVLAKDGKLFYADITASPVVYKNRPHLTATFRNVTERREVEKQKDAAVEAMSKSEARLNAFIDRAAIAIAISKDQMLTFVNPAFMRMFGYEHESELIGRSIYDIITISEHSKVKAVEKASVDKTQIIHELETVVKRKDGTEIWIHAAISDVYDYGSLGFITEITDRVKAEKELLRKEELLRATLNNVADGILLVDSNNKISHMNGQFISMWNVPPDLSESKDDGVVLDFVTKQVVNPDAFTEKVRRLYECDIEDFDEIRIKNGKVFERYSAPIMFDGTRFGRVWDFRDITKRKEAEEELRKNEGILKTLLEGTPVGIGFLINRIHIKVNNPLCRLLGYSEHELIGHGTRFLYTSDEEYERVGRDLYGHMEKDGIGIVESRLKRKDGNFIEVVLYAMPFDPDDISAGMTVSVFDITERKRVEVELKNSEAVLRGLFEASPAGIALLTPERTMLKVNHSLARITGYSEEELLGITTRFLYYNEEEFNKVGLAYQEMQRNGLGTTGSCLRRKDGSVLYVMVCLSQVNRENIDDGVVATVLDITDLKQTEQALRESEEKYRTLVENMQDAAYRCDTDGIITYITPSVERILGTPPDGRSIVGMKMEDFYCRPGDGKLVMKLLKEHGRLTHYEVMLKRIDSGKQIFISTNSQFYHDRDGNIIGVEGVFSDITERKQAEEELKKSEALLRTIFDASPAGLLVLVDRIPVKVNGSFCRLTGYSEEELVCHSTRKLYFTEEEYDHVGDKYYNRNSENVSEIETRFKRKDGSAVDILICLSPINPADEKTGYVVITLDISERKRAEEALEDSEEKYRTLVDNMQDAAYRCDMDGNIIFTSPSAARMLGAPSVESLIGKNIAGDFYYYPEEREKLVNKLKKHGKVTNFEVTLKRMDNGEPVSISTNSQFYRDKAGNIIGVEGVFSDITERKRAEKALCESEEFLRKIFDVSPIGIIYSVNRVFVKMNGYMCRISGYTEEELKGQSVRIIYADDNEYDRVGRELYSRIEMEGIATTETRLRNKNGSISSVLMSASYMYTDDMQNGIIATVIDITERKKSEEALRKNEAMLKSLLDATPIGVGLINNRLLLKVNNSLCRIMGYSEHELIGQSTRILYADENEYNRIGTELYAKMESTGLGMTESILKRRDGAILDAILCLSPFDPNDTSAGVTLTVFDITERKKIEAEKLRLEEMLLHSQKLESIGRLAGGIAHDFNNLLTAIMGNTEMAMKQLDPAGKPYSRLEVVKKAANGAANLTRQLLAFSRKQVIEPKKINFDELLQHVCKMIPALIGENIRLNVLLSAEMSSIKADAGQLEQIIINLVTNARDAMPEGGDLTIETAVVYLDENYSHLHPGVSPGSYVMMVITDTGAGMSSETLEHAFEPFFTTKETGRGTGLGLATVYGIVKQNGGTIEVYSEIGRGTSLKVYFPVVSQSNAEVEHGAEKEVILIGTETILIVEDKAEVLEFCRDVLTQSGYNVLSASSGEEALTVAENYRDTIHMLVTDVILPGINGRVTAERITSMRPGIKVLYTSGYTAEVIDKQGILEKGINYLNKPFTSHEFSARIRDILDKNI